MTDDVIKLRDRVAELEARWNELGAELEHDREYGSGHKVTRALFLMGELQKPNIIKAFSTRIAELESELIRYKEAVEWTAVIDRMPEFDGNYLCCADQVQPCGTVWHIQQVLPCCVNIFSTHDSETVTHWMKLPSAPIFSPPYRKSRENEQ